MIKTAERVNIVDTEVLSHDWYLLKKITFDYLRNNGDWQRQTRESTTGAMVRRSCCSTAHSAQWC